MTAQRELIVEVARALERMAFVISEPIDVDPVVALGQATHFASVALTGLGAGFVVLGATPGFLLEVASGMLGVDAADLAIEEYGDNTIMELANVLGGHAIHEGGGEDSPLRLGLPIHETRERALELLGLARLTGFAGVVATDAGRLVLGGILPQAH